jgi:hypothetical protein
MAMALVIAMQLAIAQVSLANDSPSFDYLYILANEGGSSGGHTAIRFGPDVYHFQSEEGLLVLRRDRAEEFLYAYALLGNRTIQSSRVSVTQETQSRLVDRFRQRHRVQEAQIRLRESLERDLRLLEMLAKHRREPANPHVDVSLPIPGLGYFELSSIPGNRSGIAKGTIGSHPARSLTLAALNDAIAEAYGREFLADRRRSLTDALGRLATRNPADWSVAPPSSLYEHPPFVRQYSSRLADLAAGLAAIDVLASAAPLESRAHHAPNEPYFELSPKETEAFRRYSKALSKQLVELVDSKRADWGETLLTGMARLLALNASIDSGSLVFLDTYPDESKTLDGSQLKGNEDIGAMMLLENRTQLDGSRAYFAKSPNAQELSWERLEERSNRYHEIAQSLQDDTPIRVESAHLVPARSAPYSVSVSLARDAAQRSQDLRLAREREHAYALGLQQLHHYDLILQNCATALFETINDSLGGSKDASHRALGGYIRSRNSLAFVPFVSSQQVSDRYRIIARESIPSYRQRRLEEMRNHESRFRVALRESNTFTSTAYHHGSDDSFFIFFTEDASVFRPLFGAANLIAAIGQSLLGVVTAPFDRGSNLTRGLTGAFVSLPELVFANIRKGSNDWVPIEYRRLEPVAR